MYINENWRITTGPSNVILQQRKVNMRGKNVGIERWENVGYYPTYKEALKAMVEYEIRIPKDFQTLEKKIDDLMGMVAALQCPVKLRDDSAKPSE